MKSAAWASYEAAAELPDRDDDDTDLEEIVTVTLPCPACGRPVTAPIEAEGDDCTCGPACVRIICDRMQAELNALMDALPAASPAEIDYTGVPY